MSAEEDHSLTSEELRKRLYQRFKQKGLLDAVKAQLRTQLIVELQRESLPLHSSEQSQCLSLLASNSLVINHLQSCGYEYSLSVFLPECGINTEKVFSTVDILQLLKISPQSPVYKDLMTESHTGQKGLLINLLSELMDRQLRWQACDADTQTSNTEDHAKSIVRTMQGIDEEYELLRQRGHRWASVEMKLAEYRKEMEEKAETDMKSKIQHFQEVEVSRLRMEEKKKCQKEVIEIRRQLERNYEMKSEALKNREKNAIERLQRQQQIEEQLMYSQRQTLLKEIECFHKREAELTLKTESFQKSSKLHEEMMRISEERLRKRELDVRKMEEMYDLMLNNEIKKHQLELNKDYNRRTETLTENENRNKEETSRIQRETAIIDSRREEYQETVNQLARLQKELASVCENVCVLNQENTELKKKLEDARDNTTIRAERMELQAEVYLLKKQLDESQTENQRLQQALKTPSPELLMLQAELKRLEAARHLDQEEFQNQKQVFHSQLSQEAEQFSRLKAQLQECEERTRWMSTHTEEIKQQLRHTQQALEIEVLRNSKPSLVDSPAHHLNPASLPLTNVDVYHDDLSDPGLDPRGRQCSWTEGEEAVAAALNRIQELEKEAEFVQEVYRSYKRKGFASQITLKATSNLPVCTPATLIKPIGAVKTVITETIDTATELKQHLPGDVTPPTVGAIPIRRLSSTPVSASKPRAHTKQALSSQREVSSILVVSSEGYPHITPPSSPQLKSTARDSYSPPKLQTSFSSSLDSSPEPEKISIQDLTESPPDFPGNLDQQTEEVHTYVEQHADEEEEKCIINDEDKERQLKEEEEDRKWQEERRLKEERRLMGKQETEEKEKTELERLQQKKLPEDIHHQEEETGRGTGIINQSSEVKTVEKEKQEEEVQDNPLHKYMLLVMQERERESKQKDELKSPEPVLLSEHKDDSIAAFSQEDADDDFW